MTNVTDTPSTFFSLEQGELNLHLANEKSIRQKSIFLLIKAEKLQYQLAE